ncbi:Divergent polysaccharide deacetylase [compost metagenome]
MFLDDVRTAEAIAGQLRLGVELARKQGSAVLIGHPYPQTLEVLEREMPRLRSQGIELINIRQMIAERSNQAMPAHGSHGVYRNR